MVPKVSICLPNLNNLRFLPERLDSILNQTFTDWELIVVDSNSDDGAWELFQNYAAQDSRIRLFQAPREGIYAGLNACLRKAQGEYIYIAMSDDTMMPNCLQKMVQALEANPNCSLCQCRLQYIDEQSKPLPDDKQWTLGARAYLGNYVDCPHKRFAPYDGLLYFSVLTVYTSLTQLLIQKQLLDNIGYFREDIGPMADFEWGMRAALLTNTIYLPELLATWRQHSSQATSSPFTPHNLALLLEMSESALSFAKSKQPDKLQELSFSRLSIRYKLAWIVISLSNYKAPYTKALGLFLICFKYPIVFLMYLFTKIFRNKSANDAPICWILRQIDDLNIKYPMLIQSE